jgi:hypothetical protein
VEDKLYEHNEYERWTQYKLTCKARIASCLIKEQCKLTTDPCTFENCHDRQLITFIRGYF